MDDYQVVVTGDAEKSMRSIAEYISVELVNPEAAVNLLRLFGKEIMSLSNMPSRIKLTPEQPWHDLGIRRKRVKNYYLYFKVDNEERVVYVMDVVYTKRNQEDQLDQFFSEENLRHLEEQVEAYKAGKLELSEHDLIED